jgi:hypothetical protein
MPLSKRNFCWVMPVPKTEASSSQKMMDSPKVLMEDLQKVEVTEFSGLHANSMVDSLIPLLKNAPIFAESSRLSHRLPSPPTHLC